MDDKRKQQSINNLMKENERKRFAKDSPVPPKQQNESYQLLVKLLQEACHLEHCLLNSYLYTACSIKSTPGEFEKIGDVDNNIRAGIQFERAREWKQSILLVAHEEMIHLHYVQCMLRALGERPCFTLPDRHPTTGNWFIPNWRAHIGEKPNNEGVQVPIEPLTSECIQHFVLYESTDALQDQDPYGPKIMALFEQLFDFEVNLNIESTLLHVDDEPTRRKLSNQLRSLYTTQLPLLTPAKPLIKVALVELPPVEELHFASIADFYLQGVAPLYWQAFREHWVVNNNRDLVNEMLSPDFAGEGFLPVGPIYRSKNFDALNTQNMRSYYRNVKSVDRIIAEIVDEGEGFKNFEERAEFLLDKVKHIGTREYLRCYLEEKAPKTTSPTKYPWLADCERLRQSHLYRFAMIMMSMKQEVDLANAVNVTFNAYRQPVNIDNNVTLKELTTQIPYYFNACYLVMIMWLSRMYEIAHWAGDKSQRQAIEMIATWPLMSLAIRPFLELASFFPIEKKELFSLNADYLPRLPLHARQLFQLYVAKDRSEKINESLDYFGVKTLADVAMWANDKIGPVGKSDLPNEQKEMILTRLKALTVLNEFESQFTFRVHGGYSSTMPDLTYQREHDRNSLRFEEHPTGDTFKPDDSAFYQDTLLLRLRFSGWGLVQLATDPDPPTDEAGCTGTQMLQPSDGKGRRLNRALVWQKHAEDLTEITRGPQGIVPEIGVNCVDISLMVAGSNTTVGYMPLQVLNSKGAVQTSGVQSTLNITGLSELQRLKPSDITGDTNRKMRIDLLEKNGFKPLLLGENHLVWKDGEPIDPFILAILIDSNDQKQQPTLLCSREIYNEDKRLLEMTPYQRLRSGRAPFGFDSVKNIPKWAAQNFSKAEAELINKPEYPTNYLVARAHNLQQALESAIHSAAKPPKPEDVNNIVSLADRMRQLIPDPTKTLYRWLLYLLHYGHSISGVLNAPSTTPILEVIRKNTGLSCAITASNNRSETNSRWLIKYTLGLMDVDALSDFVFGELYIPLTVANAPNQPIQLLHSWTFNKGVYNALKDFALDFFHAFWSDDYTYDRSNNTRSLQIDTQQKLIETLSNPAEKQTSSSSYGYGYTQTGFTDITTCSQRIALTANENNATFTWNISFVAKTEKATVSMAIFFTNQTAQANTAFEKFLLPSPDD